MSELKENLKQQIVSHLNLEDVNPSDIQDSESLFGEGLGLDSIDALELIVLVEQEYGIKITDPEKGKEVFKSVDTIAAFITANQ